MMINERHQRHKLAPNIPCTVEPIQVEQVTLYAHKSATLSQVRECAPIMHPIVEI